MAGEDSCLKQKVVRGKGNHRGDIKNKEDDGERWEEGIIFIAWRLGRVSSGAGKREDLSFELRAV